MAESRGLASVLDVPGRVLHAGRIYDGEDSDVVLTRVVERRTVCGLEWGDGWDLAHPVGDRMRYIDIIGEFRLCSACGP